MTKETMYLEIEFVCANPIYADTPTKEMQDKALVLLSELDGVLAYQQIWDDPMNPHSSLAVIILDKVNHSRIRTKILKIGKETGLTLDLEQKVSGRYVDRLFRLKQQNTPLTLYGAP
jgi:hypothetical protein